MSAVIVFGVVAVASYVFVYGLRRWAVQRAILDIPNQRSSHTIPTPRGGGAAISTLVIAVGILLVLLGQTQSLSHALIYLGGAAVIAILGFRDDLHPLSSKMRFGIQGLVALVTIVGIGYFDRVNVPLLGDISFGILGALLTLVWIVGLTNAYNFMDGSDGLAGGIALCAGLAWAWLTRFDPFASTIALAIAAASLGFLGHNWSPAKIFMGDVGSTFLGYSFAVLPLLVKDHMPQASVVGVLLLWVFVFDTGFTMIRRWRRHENLLTAHRSHLYQRLIISGRSHRFIAILYTALTILGAICAFLMIQSDSPLNILLLITLLVIAFGVWLLVRVQENGAKVANAK